MCADTSQKAVSRHLNAIGHLSGLRLSLKLAKVTCQAKLIDAFSTTVSDHNLSPYSLTATARAASSHLLNASAISLTLVLWVNTNGSTEHKENLSDTDSRSSESS